MVSQVTSFGRNGVSDWLIQRISAVILAAYTVLLTGIILIQPDMTYTNWVALFSQTWMQVFTLIALLATCGHAWIGMWTAGTDYLRTHTMGSGANTVRFLYQTSCMLILVIYLVWGVKIIWGVQ